MSRVKGNHEGQCRTIELADMGTVSSRAGVGSMRDMIHGPDLTCYLFMKIKFFLTIVEPICFGLPWWLSSKESTCNAGDTRDVSLIPGLGRLQVQWVWRIPWRRKWQPTPVFLPETSHGQRSPAATVQRVTKSQTPLSMHRY